ncbi:hypothetical protein GCM10010249_19780 [Streptomyces roseolilacinus]|uniref:Uncharacterized protein n=1 Tax=Streptomyces roseolilacinus TaxID=66904 RepID=A0A918B1W3_9ACTN|nr:hypothetical protein GCM10010249_19780 [Streptomyces roseolilacinus]
MRGSVEGQPGRPLQVLAVDATLDETPTEIGHGHVTHSDDVAGVPGQRSDRPQRGASGQVDEHVEAVRNQLACRGGDVLGGVVDEPHPDGLGVLAFGGTPGADHTQPAPDGPHRARSSVHA